MTGTTKSTFARRVRTAMPAEKTYDVRDDVIPSLTLRVYPSGVRTIALDRITRGPPRYATIGIAETMTLLEARREAQKLTAGFTKTETTDGGPRTPGHPTDAFAGEFLERHARHWKLRTLETNAGVVRRGNPARLRPPDGGRHLGRARQGLVRVRGRPAGHCQPHHARPVRHDAHGRTLGIRP